MEEELERDMKPRLIGDLGMGYPTSKSTKKYRCGLYECQYCGKEFEAGTSSVKRGHTKSCGCLRGDIHGMHAHRFYSTWYNMIKDVLILRMKIIKIMVREESQFVISG